MFQDFFGYFNSVGMSVLVICATFVRKGSQILNFDPLYTDRLCQIGPECLYYFHCDNMEVRLSIHSWQYKMFNFIIPVGGFTCMVFFSFQAQTTLRVNSLLVATNQRPSITWEAWGGL